MKKKCIIGIIIIVIAIITAFVVYNIIKENGRNYEIEKVDNYNYFVVMQNNLYGVIDKTGNTIISPKYQEVKIPNPEKAVFVCYEENNTKVLNEKNEEILTNYTNVEPIGLKNIASDLMYEKSVLRYAKDEKYGLIDFEGKEITKPIYDELEGLPYKEGELLVKQNEKYGVINIKGNNLVDIEYETITVDGYFTNENQYKNAGYIVSIKTEEGYRYGYIKNDGKEIAKPQYNELSRITGIKDDENIYLLGSKNGQYGISKNGEDIIQNAYQSIRYDEVNNVFVIEKSKKYGIANIEGKELVPLNYNQIDITGMYIYAQNDQGITVYDSQGTQVNMNANIAILNTSNENYKIKIDNENGSKYSIIDKDGKELTKETYNYIEYLYDNYFIASKDTGKLGVIDEKGNIKVELKYSSLQEIQGTKLLQATISEEKKTEVYASTMEVVASMQNAVIENNEEYIKVYNGSETILLSKEGNVLENTQVYSNNKLFAQKKDDKWGFVDKSSNVIVDYKYEAVTEFNQYGFAAVKLNGKWGAINEQGQEVVEPKYDLANEIEPFFIGKYYRVTYGYGEFYFTDKV